MSAKMYIYLICAVWALILGFAGPPLLLGESLAGLGGTAGPGIGKNWPLVRECFSLYFWGESLFLPERADAGTKLLLNGCTSLLWGVLAGRLITWIAARSKRRYKGKNEREYS